MKKCTAGPCPALIVGLVLLTGSCSIGPKYQRPAATAPTAYKEKIPPAFKETPGWKTAEPSDDALRGKWWEVYGDAELNTLEERLVASNQTLVQADATYRAARATIKNARADLFPTATGTASYTASRSSANRSFAGRGFSTGTVNDFNLPITATWEPDFWGRVHKTIQANIDNTQASAADLANTRLILEAELATDYFQLHGLDADKQLLDNTIAAYQKALDLTKSRYEQGVASQVDVVQAETQLQSVIVQRTDLDVLRSQLEHAIAVFTGRPPSELTIERVPLKRQLPEIPVSVPSKLLERRPDIAGGERRVASANEQIGIALTAFYPNITISGSMGLESSTFVNWLNWPSRFFSIGTSAAETLFDAGKRRAVTEQVMATYDATVAAYRQTVLSAFQDVEDQLSSLRVLADESVQEETAVKYAQRSEELALIQYKGGITTYLTVITAQTAALAAERSLLDLNTRRMTSTVALVKALGGGWDAGQLPSAPDLMPKKIEKSIKPPKVTTGS